MRVLNANMVDKFIEYAHLSDISYDNFEKGEVFYIGGREYKVLYEKSNESTGFYGMLVENMETGKKTAVFRGTESIFSDPLDIANDAQIAIGKDKKEIFF